MCLELASRGAAQCATCLHQVGDNWNNFRWEAHSFAAQASGTSGTLAIQSTSTLYAGAGAFVEAISVTAVPEPGTLALWVAGLGVVASIARRRN